MGLDWKKQKQKAGDNSVQQQIGHQVINNSLTINNYNLPANDDTKGTNEQEEQEALTLQVSDTLLWKRTLGKRNKIAKFLMDSYLQARESTEQILENVMQEFPELYVPKISQIESLWIVADTIIGKKYPINPLEGYILGIAFLIQDVALSTNAVDGKLKLRNTEKWNDAYNKCLDDNNENVSLDECDALTISILHADHCKKLQSNNFDNKNGLTIGANDRYIKHYKDLICRIAASRFWDIDAVESIFNTQYNPMSGMPTEWKINTQKLACILRCAVAGNIGNGRVQEMIYKFRYINNVDRKYWKNSVHLDQVCEDSKDKTKLCITSEPFEKTDFATWNVVYEAVRIFDEELKKSNHLLMANGIDAFQHDGVSGTGSKEELAAYVQTLGWQPCSFGVHTSDVKALIENLGGNKLYGVDNMLLVVFRELIQNSRDAIQARQKLDESFDNGKITIRLKVEENERIIEVEDNGIGMSLDCIKHHLLNFGSSYWRSPLSLSENTGLRSRGFKPIGKFGIGFYSVFMVSKSVEVQTKRYGTDNKNSTKIEFPEGLTLSPIVSTKCELESGVSTIVKFYLKDDVSLNLNILKYSGKDLTYLKKVLPVLVAALDVDVDFVYQGCLQRIHTNIYSSHFNKEEWLKDLFIPCPENIEFIASKMEVLIDDKGKQRGLLLPPEFRKTIQLPQLSRIYIPSIRTIGGLLSSPSLDLFGSFDGPFIGYLDGIEDNISRNRMNIDEPLLMNCLKVWTKEKYRLNHNKMINDSDVADSYMDLTGLCGIEDEIVNDNIERLYTTKGSGIKVNTSKGLFDIHRYMFVGLKNKAGEIDFNNHVNDSKIILYQIQEGNLTDTELGDKLDSINYQDDNDRKKLVWLNKINSLISPNYEDIIRLYCESLNINLLNDERILKVWVNLMLDRINGKMINWERVPGDEFNAIIESYYESSDYGQICIQICEFLKDYLCETKQYLNTFSLQESERKVSK